MAGPDKTRCAICGVRDHALGGRDSAGDFMLALPVAKGSGAAAWPKLGTLGWCGTPDGEVKRLTIVRIALARAAVPGRAGLLCQHCFSIHCAEQGVFVDLFAHGVSRS